MSSSATAFAVHAGPFVADLQPPRRKAWFAVDLVELVRPDGYWPQPLSIEQAFETFRQMVVTGKGYSTPERWGHRGVVELLSATSGVGLGHVYPIRSLADLRTRFHYAILGRAQSESQARWRKDHSIDISSRIRVRAPVYEPFAGADHLGWESEARIQDDLSRITTGSAGLEMAVSLNSIHPDCRFVHHVAIHPGEHGFSIALQFGERPDGPASCWRETLAQTREGESFLDTLARARNAFDVLVHGKDVECDLTDVLRYHTHFGKGPTIEEQVEALRSSNPRP